MSTLTEIAESKVTIYVDQNKNPLAGVAKHAITLSVLVLCIYISKGSAWWTLFTGSGLLFFIWCRISEITKTHATTFDNATDAIKYLRELELKS